MVIVPYALRQAAKNAIENTYIGTCDIFEYVHETDPVSKMLRKRENAVVLNQPCRLSYKFYNRQLKSTMSSDTASEVRQSVKLFISPDVDIKPGSKIVVTQNGVVTAYKKSGQPSVYFSHQEIMLELFDDFA